MEAYIKLFNRDLTRLKLEIELFESEESLWKAKGDISNSAGNLCLHIVGNLNHFIGAIIGSTGYVRNRDAEFSDRDISKEKLMAMVDETEKVVSQVLHQFDPSLLKKIYPIQVFGEDMTYEFFLIHLLAHLDYHMGQINYLRRLL